MSPRLLLIALVLASTGCATEFPGDPAELDRLEYPAAMVAHPNGKYLYVVNANFDLKYRSQDGGTLSVVEVETGKILVENSIRIPSFAGDIVLNEDASRGYIAVREDASVIWFNLTEEGDQPFCPLSDDADTLAPCRFDVPAEPTGLAVIRSGRSQPVLDSDGRQLVNGDGDPRVVEQTFDLLTIAHLRGGLVSVATVGDTSGAQEPAFSIGSAALVDGPSSIQRHQGERFFVTGRSSASIVGFRPAIGTDGRVIGIFVDSVIPIPTPFTAHEGRSLLFSGDRQRLYMTDQAPHALVIVDTSASDDESVSGRRDQVIGMLDLPRGPNRMALIEHEGRELLYITSFNEDSLTIVDPSIPAVIGEAPLGNGPFELLIDRETQRAYVTNFLGNSISEVDISDPLNPVQIRELAALESN